MFNGFIRDIISLDFNSDIYLFKKKKLFPGLQRQVDLVHPLDQEHGNLQLELS